MEKIKFIPGTGNAYGCDEEGNIYSYYLPGSHLIGATPQLHKQYIDSKGTYMLTGLSLNGICNNYLVHRLIALTWIPNPNNLPEIDHIDNNPKNNNVKNLQWIDRIGNIDKQEVDKGELNGLRSHTKLYSPENVLIAEFSSMREACEYAAEHFNCSKSGMSKYHKSQGYYIVADNEEKRKMLSRKTKSTYRLYSPNNEYIKTFSSKCEAARYIKENIRDISVKRFSDLGKAYGYYVIEESVETKLA